ncbi:MAG: hypothetical protein CMJ37_02630 [Phycisphaerae bacterium]|nr:hypothetical protein [Phycisphaerae bacterium]
MRSSLLWVCLSSSCFADYVSMFVERGNVPAFPGTTTYRIFATFDNPGDKVIALAGLPPTFPLEFSSTGGDLIQDDLGLECVFDSLLQNVITGPADSFLTIRSVDSLTPFPAIGDDIGPAENPYVGFTPEVLCNAIPQVPVQGSSWSTGDEAGGIISTDPSGDEGTGQAVLLAQFTLPDGDDFTFSGTVNYTLAGESGALIAFFSIDTASLPFSAECDTIDEFFVILNSGTPTDCNNNGIMDLCESPDENGDGLSELCPDCDADGIPDLIEIKQGTAIDLNGNGIDDECDPDCDQNGVPDFFQIEQGEFDCNLDGVLDSCEISENPALDLNTNAVIDSCEADCNENGTFDFLDILLELSQDINKNSVPDECEDCDGDGIPDDLEDKADCDGNGLPDVCEADEDCDKDGDINACDFDDDGDGIDDLCDADSCGVTGQDCDENGILDSCEGFSDCNNNGIDDRCDIQSGEEEDLNLDGTPDSCQCIADVVPNGEIGFPDLVTLLSAWGTCEAPCPSDIIADGDVGFSDLLCLLSNWGKCFNLPGGGGGNPPF